VFKTSKHLSGRIGTFEGGTECPAQNSNETLCILPGNKMVCLMSQTFTILGQIRIATPPAAPLLRPWTFKHEECRACQPGRRTPSSAKTSAGSPWVSCKQRTCVLNDNFRKKLRHKALLTESPIKRPLQFQEHTLKMPPRWPNGRGTLLGPLLPFICDGLGEGRFDISQFNAQLDSP